MNLCRLDKEAVAVTLETLEKDEALERVIDLACSAYASLDRLEIQRLIIEREGKLSTGIGLGVAVPHCRVTSVTRTVAAALLCGNGVEYNSVDRRPVHLIFLLISPVSDIQGHLACLSQVSKAASDGESLMRLLGAQTAGELFDTIRSCGL